MDERGMIYFSRGLAFEIGGNDHEDGEDPEEDDDVNIDEEQNSVEIMASYPDEPLLLSGWIFRVHLNQYLSYGPWLRAAIRASRS